MIIQRHAVPPTINKKQCFFLMTPVLLLWVYLIYKLFTYASYDHLSEYQYKSVNFSLDRSNFYVDEDTDLFKSIKMTTNQIKISRIFNYFGGYSTENTTIIYIKKHDPQTFKKLTKRRKNACKIYPEAIGKTFSFQFFLFMKF